MEKKNIVTLRKLINSVVKSYYEDPNSFIFVYPNELKDVLTNITTDVYNRIKEEGFATYASNKDFDNYVKVAIVEINNQFTIIVKISKNPVLSNGLNGNNTDYVKIEDTYEDYLELPIDIKISTENKEVEDIVKEDTSIVEEDKVINTKEPHIPTVEEVEKFIEENIKLKLTREIYSKISDNLFYVSTKLNKLIFDLNNYSYNSILEANFAIDSSTIINKINEVSKLYKEYDFDLIIEYDIHVNDERREVSYYFMFNHFTFGKIEYRGEYNNQDI